MTEEANLLAGLLVGLNSFDYTVYLKGDDSVLTAFEHEPVIDLQYYLQDPYGAADVQVFSEKKQQQQQQQMTNGEQLNNSENSSNGSKDEVDREEMATAAAAAAAPDVEVLLEQNSYVEEINKHLKATIKTLEEKIETLLERRSGSVSSSSNDGHNSSNQQPQPHSSSSARSLMEFGTALVAKEKQIMEEERRRREAEKRLEMEAKLREESETARNCLERDIQEKQETIVTLRAQLDEVKAINITMFSRLQEREREAKERARRTAELETLLGQQKKEIGQLEKRCAQLSESLDSGGNHNDHDHDHNCDSSGKDELLASYQKLIDEQQEQMTVLQLE
ncbi:PREDICTED: protein RUFY3-like, partial [Rhagoletis zephyria]|uniref:protein RUFY3-like n=1 Tax=Rhagoletis zephyria TaxID=28612 RepID=UPI000811A15E